MSATQTYVGHFRRLQGIQLFKNSFFMIANKGVVATRRVRLLAAGDPLLFDERRGHRHGADLVGQPDHAVLLPGLRLLDHPVLLEVRPEPDVQHLPDPDGAHVRDAGRRLRGLRQRVLAGAGFLQSPAYALVFLAYITISVVATIGSTTFIAARKAEFSFLQNLLLMLRLPLLIPLAFLGAFGILTSIGIAYVLVCLAIVYLIGQFVRLKFTVDTEFVKKSLKFSFGNYVAQIFLNFTYFALPTMILGILGSAEAAKYYIAYTIGNLLLQVPDAIGMSLFVEGSHGESMRKNVLRAGTAMYAVLIPGVIFIFIFGGKLLSLFHGVYSDESVTLLRLFAIVSLFFAIYCLMVPIQNVRMNVQRIIKINMLIFVLFMGMSYLLMTRIGIVGVGVALLVTFMIVDVVIVSLAKLDGWI